MSDDNQNDDLDKTSIIPSDTFKVQIAEAGKAPPCIVLLVGPANMVGRQWPIEDTGYVIGRSPNAEIYVDDRSVSKSHCKVLVEGGQVSLIDLESTNKTIINGKHVQPMNSIVLKNNDQVKTGNVIFKFLEKGNIETVSVAQAFDRGQIDALTMIYNKGALMGHGPEAFKKSNMLDVPLSIITFDIDHFKKVNDTYGHSAGDHVLIEVSRMIRESHIRENDFFSRSGGEEFTLLLLGTPIGQAKEIAERLRTTIQNNQFVYEGTQIPVTISLGVAARAGDDFSWEQIFERADEALYKSKQGGRNQVTVSEN